MISIESGLIWEFKEGICEEVVFELNLKVASVLTKSSVMA